MSTKKWGETFLKTGLPLEHVTLTALTGAGWQCEPKWEYRRENRDRESVWFKVDLIAHGPPSDAGSITILTECKYHDQQRFWVFLPCSDSALAQRGAPSAGGDPESDREVVHHGPYEPLIEPNEHTMIGLAPRAMWGVTVSRAGVREEYSVYHALEQLSHAYVPFCLDRAYNLCHHDPEAIVSAVVTSAKLFRLKAWANAIEEIRRAGSAHEIAEEVPALWCYHPPSGALLDDNSEQIDTWRARPRHVQTFAGLDDRLAALWSGPRWFLIVNVEHVAEVYGWVQSTYASLPKNFARSKMLCQLIEKGAKKAREQRKRSVS
jgi:hypothetical protein